MPSTPATAWKVRDSCCWVVPAAAWGTDKQPLSAAAVTLRNISDALAPGGFLLLLELSSALPAAIWGLDARTWAFTDERDYGLWMTKARWRSLLARAGLTSVAEHW